MMCIDNQVLSTENSMLYIDNLGAIYLTEDSVPFIDNCVLSIEDRIMY